MSKLINDDCMKVLPTHVACQSLTHTIHGIFRSAAARNRCVPQHPVLRCYPENAVKPPRGDIRRIPPQGGMLLLLVLACASIKQSA